MPGYVLVTDAGDLTPMGKLILGKTFARIDGVATGLPVTIWGNSHVQNWDANTGALASALGRAVTAVGVSGQQSAEIAARQGGVPAYVTVTGNLIPASGSVAVTGLTSDGAAVSPLRHGGSGSRSRPAVLCGVVGALRTDDQGVTYIFDRTTPGLAVPAPAGSPLVMGIAERATVPIFVAPRNDVGKNAASTLWRSPLEKIVSRYERMIRWGAPGGKFLVLSMLPWSDEDAAGTAARLQLDAALRDLAPQQWVDWAAFLRSDAAFTAAGITKTSQDSTDIAAGITPSSFRIDTGHINAAAYTAANTLVASAMLARGF